MNTKRIVYQLPGRPVSVLIPAECGLTLLEIGKKDVPPSITIIPTGEFDLDEYGDQVEIHQRVAEKTPFWIIESADLPQDRSLRNAWDLDVDAMGEPDGYGGEA